MESAYMRKLLLVFSFLAFFFLVVGPKEAYAKKVLPTRRTSGTTVSKSVATSAKFRRDRRALIVSFSGLASARTIDYLLSYNSRGTTQGAGGSINPTLTGNTASRELLFGTCSHGVCRYDTGITNARLVITIVLSSGKKITRTYRLRV
jgi:hypothetical protein